MFWLGGLLFINEIPVIVAFKLPGLIVTQHIQFNLQGSRHVHCYLLISEKLERNLFNINFIETRVEQTFLVGTFMRVNVIFYTSLIKFDSIQFYTYLKPQ